MLGFVRVRAEKWAEQRFVRANRVLRYRLKLAEEARQQLTESVDRLKVRRGIDRDVRVRAETQVAELTQANLNLSALLTEVLTRRAVLQVDPVRVEQALIVREAAAEVFCNAVADHLEADAAYRGEWNAAYHTADGAEHLRKVAAELAAAERRAARDAAEVAKAVAEQGLRQAELAFRAALAGAVADEAGDRP